MHIPDLLILLALITGAAASAHWKKLTPAAALTGGIIGALVYTGTGYTGLLLLTLFFILGTAATAWKKKDKLRIKGNAAHQSTRTTGQVIANGGIAAILGALAALFPAHQSLFSLLLAASLSSATADTLSSELGMLYGRRNVNILTGKRDERGLDGVISLEGLLIGIAGSALIAAAWLALKTPAPMQNAIASATQSPLGSAVIIITAGLVGNLADSLLGATLERKGVLSNNAVNFANTAIAVLCAGALTGFRG
jgi:uncharacterized protein (TIGR00297 family)